MKVLPILLTAVTLAALPGCTEKQSTSEKVQDAVNDALDRRPAESIRDAAEDVRDAAKDAAQDVKDAARDAKEAATEMRDDIRQDIKDAAK
jgi:hypothetical protein